MFESLTTSADGLLILLGIVSVIIFFLFGAHKVYEAIFGALIGIGLYIFLHEITFITPDVTRSLVMGNWFVENRGSLLWIAKISAVALFIVTPFTAGLNSSGAVRGTAWFFIKTVVLALWYVCFAVVLFSILSTDTPVFRDVRVIPDITSTVDYFKNSRLFMGLVGSQYAILFIGFLLCLYKIIASHWMGQVALLGGAVYVKSQEFFAKKPLDVVVPTEPAPAAHDDKHA